jgi:spore coat protein A, manganese oxidase
MPVIPSRIPTPALDDRYRWATPLFIPPVIDLVTRRTIEFGATSAPHVFAAAIGAFGLPAIKGPAWGYGPSGNISSPGPTLVAQADKTALVKWKNRFSRSGELTHPFRMPPRDLAAAGMMPRYSAGRSSVHLHGAHLPWKSDGYPMRLPKTLTKDFANPTGHCAVLRPGQSLECVYPNTQPGGATLWYHDHTMDSTAHNVYAGMAGMYWLRHAQESLASILPKDAYEVPIILHDQSFVRDQQTDQIVPFYGDASFLADYAGQVGKSVKGGTRQDIRDWLSNAGGDPQGAMAEFKGTIACVNGKVWPYLEVEPKAYRFRIVNAATSRFFALRISEEAAALAGQGNLKGGNRNFARPALPIFQIGSDGGFLQQTVILDGASQTTHALLVLAPGERADVIIDFAATPKGKLYVTNHATDDQPFGNGGDLPSPGLENILQFRVLKGPAAPRFSVSAMDQALMSLHEAAPSVPANPEIKALVIKEFPDLLLSAAALKASASSPSGPRDPSWAAIPFQNDLDHAKRPGVLWSGASPKQKPPALHKFGGPPSGGPFLAGDDHYGLNAPTHYWDIYNISADTHPIHIHLTQFHIVERREIKKGNVKRLGDPIPPDPNERGWKDTVRANKDQFVRLAVRFDDAGDTHSDYSGNFVFHCHLLDHEDMGMMRPVRID